ncbi:hypothetical protein C0Q70_14041 [Pomacea canaliculata]|uniref:Uncharacterized protein n=1 Tax=Pomacea canaliculata TaxID=400727 RepID=A0A2T7NYW3_POMCA|nr:hypothetical protein C0Q70_14041 [Pomacea canaliculata]
MDSVLLTWEEIIGGLGDTHMGYRRQQIFPPFRRLHEIEARFHGHTSGSLRDRLISRHRLLAGFNGRHPSLGSR